MGRGLNEVRVSYVEALGRMPKAEGKRRARRPVWAKQRVRGSGGDHGGQAGWGRITQGFTGLGRTRAFTLHEVGAPEDLSRGGIGSWLLFYNVHSGCWKRERWEARISLETQEDAAP